MAEPETGVLQGWGHSTASSATLLDPSSVADVVAAVRGAGSRGVLGRGLGRSYGDAAQNGGGVVVLPLHPTAPVDLGDDGVARLSAGTSLARALRELLPHGRTLPVLPGTGHVTVAGAIAADVHGKNHHCHGGFGRWTRSIELVDGAGEPRSLSPERTGPEFWATVGGMGLTGIITSARVQTVPVPSGRLLVRTRRLGSLPEIMAALRASTATYHVAWIDAASRGGFGRGVLEEAEHDARPSGLDYRARRALRVPRLPVNTVRPVVSRHLNRAWWHHASRDTTRIADFRTFFHPLDAVGDWPWLYGPAGFLQWQFAVPDTAARVVELALRALADTGHPPSLVVLKRLGPRDDGPLSFPIPGWTVAVDLPADRNVAPVLDRLDSIVAEAGGRVYLAKDARLGRDQLDRMYGDLAGWRAVRDELDPRGVFASDLSRRLGLT